MNWEMIMNLHADTQFTNDYDDVWVDVEFQHLFVCQAFCIHSLSRDKYPMAQQFTH